VSTTPPPRFVPILTEVVQSVPDGEAKPVASLPDGAGDVRDEVVRRVTQGVLGELEPLLREAFLQLAAHQARSLDGLRADIAALVARRVDEALHERPPE